MKNKFFFAQDCYDYWYKIPVEHRDRWNEWAKTSFDWETADAVFFNQFYVEKLEIQ